jgi:glycosyltransferase involved in cell wall biosynthesis
MDNQLQAEDPPRFSVVIPTFNRADTVCRAIESVLHQTFPAAEIIIVDDGSRDATAERLKVYGDALRYIYQENAGAAAARNHGVREARFPWLAFLDSDDVWSPDYLEHMAAAIAATGGVAVLYFSDAEFEASPSPANRWAGVGFSAQTPFEMLHDAPEIVLAEAQPMLLPFSVFQRHAFLDAGGLWEQLSAGEDTHLYVRLGLRYPLCAVTFLGGVVKGETGDAERLTGAYGPRSLTHWDCSIILWNDILRRTRDLSSRHRRLLNRRVADAYWRKAILSAHQHHVLAAAGFVCRSLIHNPSVAVQATARTLSSQR